MEGELVVVLDKDVERPVLRIPGVVHLHGATYTRSIQEQIQLGREGKAERHRSVLPLHLLELVAVAVTFHLLHASGEECAHPGGLAPCARDSGLAPCPGRGLAPASTLVRLATGVGALTGAQRLRLDGCDKKGRRWMGVSVAVGVERLSPVPLRVPARHLHTLHHP